jgi:predicted DNA-binding transcriptional regulator AlpA
MASRETSRRRTATHDEIKLFADDELYSAQQIAAKLKIHVVSVWRWTRQKRLPPAKRIGPNCTRFSGSALNAYLDNADA